MKDKLLLKAIRREPIQRPPIWVMRQAGRYLPEYHQTKEKAGGFLGLCRIPDHGIEVTMQPIRRFGFDAAILFSDILTPLEPMGISLDFNPGPIIGNPVRTMDDVNALVVPDIEKTLPYVLEILRGLKQSLPKETTLIGFAGAPFTVASYAVAKQHGKGTFNRIRAMAYEAPAVLKGLFQKLEAMTIAYLEAQIRAGAEVVQLFDSSAWQLPGHLFEPLALAPARRIFAALKSTKIPTIYFAPGAMGALPSMTSVGADVVGVDWRCDLGEAREILGPTQVVQGNLDPAVLLAGKHAVKREAMRIITQNRYPGHIFNLGHGVLPDTPIESMETLVQTVKESGKP